ncbi:hypothetical protein, partial [Mesorhizobium sp. M7A.F.Ca.CA.002.05.1.1]
FNSPLIVGWLITRHGSLGVAGIHHGERMQTGEIIATPSKRRWSRSWPQRQELAEPIFLLPMNDNRRPNGLGHELPTGWQRAGVLIAAAALVSSLCALLLASWMSG